MPVANPEGVAPLLAIALAASEPGEPPPRVIALVRPPADADRYRLNLERDPAPRTPALLAAIEYARARNLAIEAQAVWSDDPALDIIAAARTAQVGWILLGYHRTASGSDAMGGMVREVLARAETLPINVGVFVQGTDQPIERIFAAVDAGPDGRAALALAVRVARSYKSKLRALLVASDVVQQPDDDLLEMVREAREKTGRRFHSDVLTQRSLDQLFRQTPGRLLIVGKKFADEVGMPLDDVPGGGRCVIVVQGGEPDSASAIQPAGDS